MSSVVVHVAQADAVLEQAVRVGEMLHERMPGLQVRIIVNGAALAHVLGGEPLLHSEGVGVFACSAGLAARGSADEPLRPGIGTVPSASVALVQAQLEGSAYLRL